MIPEREPAIPQRVPDRIYSVRSTPELVSEVNRDLVRWTFTRPRWIWLFVLVVVMGVVFATAGLVLQNATLVTLAIVLVALEGFVAFMHFRRISGIARQALAIGSEYRLTLSADSLVFETPLSRTETAYAAFSAVATTRSVVLVSRKAGTTQMVPRALIDDEGVASLTQRIALANLPV